MASLGQFLRRERELRGITLEEIATTTKISLKFLKALENDSLETLPGEFFIKGIIRSYAKSIGLEEEYVLNKYYEESLLKQQVQRNKQRNEQKKGKPHTSIFPKKEKFLNLVFFSVLVILIITSIYLISRPQRTRTTPPETKVTPEIQEEKVIPPPVEEEREKEKEGIKELNIAISFLQDTWIQVYADGELVLDGVKKPGEEAKVKALQELVLNLGNAGGISYSLNGKQGKALGSSGAVVKDIRITIENYTQFIEQKENREDR